MGQRTHKGYRQPNYTQVANDLIDLDMLDMNEAELKVHLVLFRLTIGWHRTGPVPVSVPEFIVLTGIESETTIRTALKRGKERGTIIEADERGPRGVKRYALAYLQDKTSSEPPADPPPPDPGGAPPQNLRGSKNEGDQNLGRSDGSTPPESDGVQGEHIKKDSLKKEDSSADGAGDTPPDESKPAPTAQNSGKRAKKPPKPKQPQEPPERKCPGPYNDNLAAVSEVIAGTEDAFSTRFGSIASWLSGGEQDLGDIIIPGLSPFAMPDEIRLFRSWYEDHYGNAEREDDDQVHMPRKLDLWMEYFPQFRADKPWHERRKRQEARRARRNSTSIGASAFQSLVQQQRERAHVGTNQ